MPFFMPPARTYPPLLSENRPPRGRFPGAVGSNKTRPFGRVFRGCTKKAVIYHAPLMVSAQV